MVFVGNNWLVAWLVDNAIFSETAGFGDIHKKFFKLAQSQTLIFFSKTVLTIFLGFGLKLVLNMTFNLTETYCSEKFTISRLLASKSSKNCPN